MVTPRKTLEAPWRWQKFGHFGSLNAWRLGPLFILTPPSPCPPSHPFPHPCWFNFTMWIRSQLTVVILLYCCFEHWDFISALLFSVLQPLFHWNLYGESALYLRVSTSLPLNKAYLEICFEWFSKHSARPAALASLGDWLCKFSGLPQPC